MRRQSRFTPAFLKIAIPFYLVIGVLVMGIGAAKSGERVNIQNTIAPSTISQVANSETERG